MKNKLNIFLWRLVYKLQEYQVTVNFEFTGDKSKSQVHSLFYQFYNPHKDCFIIDWDKKTVSISSKNTIISRNNPSKVIHI